MYDKIAFYNEKGGVGKSTFALNTAIIFSRCGFRVLLLDLDSQADSTSFFQLEDEVVNKASLYNVIYNKTKIQDIIHKISKDLSLISNTNFEEINTFLGNKPKGYLNKIFESIKNDYDFIIVDCSPTKNNINEHILYFTDYITLVTTPEYLSFRAILNVYKHINTSLKEDKIKNIIINKVKANNEHKEIIGMLEEVFHNKSIFKFKDKINIGSSIRKMETFYEIKDEDLQVEMNRLIKEIAEQWKN